MDNQPARLETDVLVVGATPAGCAAAIAAAREGARVVLLEPTSSVGGVCANGVPCFDAGSLQALSGIAEEFCGCVLRHYEATGLDDPLLRSGQNVFWEFHVAEQIWRAMLADQDDVTLIASAVPVGVTMDGATIAAVLWEPAVDPFGNPPAQAVPVPNQVRAAVVIDATYEGDVAAWAGAPFDLGREARSPAEPHAGIIYTASHEHQVSAAGFLPATILPGSSGAASEGVMAFTSRLSLRWQEAAGQRRPVPRPDGYDPAKYRWTPPVMGPDGRPSFGFDLIPAVNGKMLLNQREKGNDVLAETREFILAHPRERTAIRKRMFDHILGFLHFIQTSGGSPELSLAEDEYPGNGNVPHLLYVREGRRFRGRARLTESNVNPFLAGPGPRPPRQPESVAIGDWAIECRPCSDRRDPATEAYEGAILARAVRAPYQVPFGCLVPQGVDNLLVTTTISASHVAFCALRIEAVWAGTGTAAGIAAALAKRGGCRAGEVPVAAIQGAMLASGCKLTYFSDVGSDHSHFAAIQWLALRGFLPNNWRFDFLPDSAATWDDLVEASVCAFGLPASVTGLHFDGLDPGHPAFRHAETLYDVASRAGVILFANMRHPVIDAPADHLRAEPRTRWVEFPATRPVHPHVAHAFVDRLVQALGLPPRPFGAAAGGTALSRGALAHMLWKAAEPG